MLQEVLALALEHHSPQEGVEALLDRRDAATEGGIRRQEARNVGGLYHPNHAPKAAKPVVLRRGHLEVVLVEVRPE